MKKLGAAFREFISNKIYMIMLSLTAVCSYGFMVSHPTVGIDDTAIPAYFQDGLAPAMGRWSLYLLNKLFHVSDFAPWMTELAGVLLLMASATLWCAVIYQIAGRTVSVWGYAFFAALFISCPLISEVYVYYLHNGISIAYGVTALAVFGVMQSMGRTAPAGQTVSRGRNVKRLLGASLGLTVAMGFYESFIIVYVIGILLIFFLMQLGREEWRSSYELRARYWAGAVLITGVAAVVLRSVILAVLRLLFHIGIPDGYSVWRRNIFENVGQSIPDLLMVLKKFWVMYYLNGFCYLPITVFSAGVLFLCGYGLYQSVRRRNVWLALSVLAVPVAPLALVIIEGYPTHYRASQYVPIIGAFAVFLVFQTVEGYRRARGGRLAGGLSKAAIVLAGILLWNQCADMNKWFYVDYMKYEDTRNVMNAIACDLESGDYDLSKRVVFRGAYLAPYELVKGAYLDFDNPKYRLMRKITDVVDEHLLEKFNAEDRHGYVFAQTPINSALRWGITAFDGTAGQLEILWRMHGHDITVERDLKKIEEAERRRGEANMPSYPRKGYIMECEEYIIVNF